jgi:hypothetical protein
MWAKDVAQSKQSPIGLKLAQSCHPVCRQEKEKKMLQFAMCWKGKNDAMGH